jgi:hypothetical protein
MKLAFAKPCASTALWRVAERRARMRIPLGARARPPPIVAVEGVRFADAVEEEDWGSVWEGERGVEEEEGRGLWDS